MGEQVQSYRLLRESRQVVAQPHLPWLAVTKLETVVLGLITCRDAQWSR